MHSQASKTQFICQRCGTSFWRRPDRPALFCSTDCKKAASRKSKPLVCARCQQSFLAQPVQILRGRAFCSRECYDQDRAAIPERFWAKVAKAGPDDCWLWIGTKYQNGYGHFMLDQAGDAHKQIVAHRMAWILTHGPVAEDLCVCHACDVPACCNPSHLWLGTKADNARDHRDKRRQWQQKKTHCPQGHPYSPENTVFINKNGHEHRICKTCHKVYFANWYAKQGRKKRGG